LEDGGAIFIQTSETSSDAIWAQLPESARKEIQLKGFHVYGLDATNIAKTVARSADLINRMQGIVLLGVFLKVTPLAKEHGLDKDHLFSAMEKIVRKYFGKRGEKAIEDNMTCIRKGFNDLIEVATEPKETAQYVS
jgi:pyruvate-ferredoxin/flavodoxin oxidoreductase